MPGACAQKGQKKRWGMEPSGFLPSHRTATRSARRGECSAHVSALSWAWDEGTGDSRGAGGADTRTEGPARPARAAGRRRPWSCRAVCVEGPLGVKAQSHEEQASSW